MKKKNITEVLRKSNTSNKHINESDELYDKLLTTIPESYSSKKEKQSFIFQNRYALTAVFVITILFSFWKIYDSSVSIDQNNFIPTKVIYLSDAELDKDYFKPTKIIHVKKSEVKTFRRENNENVKEKLSSDIFDNNFIAFTRLILTRNACAIFG